MDTASIKTLIEEVLKQMAVVVEAVEVITDPTDPIIKFVIKTKESGLLIGNRGEHFNALNFLIKRLVAKRFGEEINNQISIDVNDYQQALINEIKNKAIIMANRALSFKIDVELEPMSSFERLVIHSTLAGRNALKTESIGDGRNRRVVIRYKEPATEDIFN